MKKHQSIWLIYFTILHPATQIAANAGQPQPLKNYQLQTDDCVVALSAKNKGLTYINGMRENFTIFSEWPDARGWALSFHFQCFKENAKNYCPATWTDEVVERDPIVLKRVAVRRYNFQHPHYYSLVYASSFNNSEPPRPRTLYFCLGDESRTVAGWVPIGDEKKQFPTQALKIINTLQIHPTVNAQTHP